MWELPQNDGPTANVLMHIIIYSIVYGKKKRICIRIDSAGLYIYFGIRATVKLKKKWGVTYYFGIRVQVAQSYGIENVFVFVLVFEYILKVKVLVVQWTLHKYSIRRFTLFFPSSLFI